MVLKILFILLFTITASNRADGTDLSLVRSKGFLSSSGTATLSQRTLIVVAPPTVTARNLRRSSVIIDLSPFHGALSTTNNLFELKRVAKLRALKNSFPPPGYESNEGQFSFRLALQTVLVNGP